MDAPRMIVVHVGAKHTVEMPLVEHDDMIEHVSPDAANDPLAVRILPRALRGYLDLFDAHGLCPLLKNIAVDAVAVAEQIARRFLPGKCFDHLLRCPLRRWVFCNVKMDDASAIVSQHDEDKEHSERGGWHREEVTRHNVFDMVAQKGFPCR